MPWDGVWVPMKPQHHPMSAGIVLPAGKSREEHTDDVFMRAVSRMGMKLSKENTLNPMAVPAGEAPQGHFPHPMAMVEGARSCTQVSESALQKFTEIT